MAACISCGEAVPFLQTINTADAINALVLTFDLLAIPILPRKWK